MTISISRWGHFFLLVVLSSVLPAEACWELEPSPDRLRAALFNVCSRSMKPFLPFDYACASNGYSRVDVDYNDRWRNVKEWMAELKHQPHHKHIDPADVYRAQYQMSESEFAYRLTNPNGNTFILALLLPSNSRHLEYFKCAKKLEDVDPQSSWDYVSPSAAVTNVIEICTTPSTRRTTESSRFLRFRYLYQHIRTLARNRRDEEVILLTRHVDSRMKSSVVYGWLQMYRAIACRNLNDTIGCNLACAESFRLCDEKKYRVKGLFYDDKQSVQSSLRKTTNVKTRLAIMTLLGMQTTGPAQQLLESMVSTSRAVVNTPSFLFLIKREVNKLEDRILTAKLYGRAAVEFPDPNSSPRLRRQRMITFIQSIIADSRGEFKAVLSMAEAHLLFLDNRYEQASEVLVTLERRTLRDTSLVRQVLVERLYYTATTSSAATLIRDKALVLGISKLERIAQRDSTFSGKSLQGILELIALRLLHQGELVNGALCYAKAQEAMYGSADMSQADQVIAAVLEEPEQPSAIEQLLRLMRRKRRGIVKAPPLTKYLMAQDIRDTVVYNELLARLYARRHDWSRTLSVYAGIDSNAVPDEKRTMWRNPFVSATWPYAHDRRAQFGREDFVRNMAFLKRRVSQNNATLVEHLKYAHGLLNVSYYGHAWMVLKSSWSVRDGIGVRNYQSKHTRGQLRYINDNGTRFAMFANRSSDRNYYLLSDARREYQHVYNHARNREMKAQAIYGLHLCDYWRSQSISKASAQQQNSWLTTEAPTLKRFDFRRLRELYNQYTDTKSFATLDCPTLAYFVQSVK